MHKIKKIIISFIALLALTPAALTVPAYASSIEDGINATGSAQTCKNASGGNSTNPDDCVNNLVANIVNILSWIIGVIAVIMIIIGGFKYITSGGDSGGISSAKNTILYAIVGLIVVAFAQIIVRFVLNKATTG